MYALLFELNYILHINKPAKTTTIITIQPRKTLKRRLGTALYSNSTESILIKYINLNFH